MTGGPPAARARVGRIPDRRAPVGPAPTGRAPVGWAAAAGWALDSRAPVGRAPADDGIATVWAAAGVAAIMAVLVFGLQLGSAIVARHRAESAADLAALAAAGLAARGQAVACGRAGEIATAMGGTVTECTLVGWNALVAVRVEVPLAVVGNRGALGRAAAGPAEGQDSAQWPDQPGTHHRRAVESGRAVVAAQYAQP